MHSLAYLLNLTSAGWASLTNFAEGAHWMLYLGLGMAIDRWGNMYLWKQIDDAWEDADGDTWDCKTGQSSYQPRLTNPY